MLRPFRSAGRQDDGRGYSYGAPKPPRRPAAPVGRRGSPSAMAPRAYPNLTSRGVQGMVEEGAGVMPLPEASYDPMADLVNLYGALGLTPPGGGGGGGGGGGAAAPVNPDPLGWRAIQREQTRRTGYDPLFENLDTELAQEQKASADREAAIRQATADARARASGITQGLTQSAADMQQRIGGAYAAGGSELDRLIADYGARQQAVQGGAARTLGAFGVGPEELGLIGPSAADSLGVMRGGLAGLGAVSQASMSALPTAYQALGGDFEMALTQGEQARLAKEQADRTAIERDINRRRAQLGLDLQGDIFGIQDAEYARQGAYQ